MKNKLTDLNDLFAQLERRTDVSFENLKALMKRSG